MSERDEILEQAMQLAPHDRAFVADAFEQCLSSAGFGTPELAEAWASEIERRLRAYDRGELSASDSEPAVSRIRQSLAEFRARKVAS